MNLSAVPPEGPPLPRLALALDRDTDYLGGNRCASIWRNGRPVRDSKSKITILLVDDHPVVRQGLRSLLAKHGQIEIVGEAGDGAEALRQVKKLQPDLVLLDLIMPGMDGLTVTETLRRQSPRVKVLLLSMEHQPGTVSRIMQAGARGYIRKDAPTDELLRKIQAVHAQNAVFSPVAAAPALNPGHPGADEREPLQRLSAREREVLVQIAEGRTNKEIAARLRVGVRTVETHRERTMQKLKIRSVAGLTKFALAHGLISLDPGQPTQAGTLSAPRP